MGRIIGVMAASLAVGAAGMYGLSHFTIRLEPVGRPSAPVGPGVPVDPPAVRDRIAPPEAGRVVQAVAFASHEPQPPVAPPPAAPLVLSAPPSAAVVPLAAAVAEPPVKLPATRITRVDVGEQLDSKTLSWDVTGERTVALHARTGTITLQLADPPTGDGMTLAVSVNQKVFAVAGQSDKLKELGITPNDPKNPTALTIALGDLLKNDVQKNGGKVEIAVAAWSVPIITPVGAPPTNPVVLVPPPVGESPTSKGFVVNGTFNSPYLKEIATSGTTSVLNGYLRVRGQAAVPGPTVRFFVIRDGVTVTPIAQAKPVSLPPGDIAWEYELDLGLLPTDTPGYVVARLDAGDGRHYYAPKVLPVVWKSFGTPGTVAFDAVAPVDPLAPKAADELASKPGLPAYRTNNANLIFAVKVAKPANAQAVLLYVGDARTAALPVGADPTITFANVKVSGDGDYKVSVVAANGAVLGAPTSLLLRVRTVGPKVVSVSAPGFVGTTPGGEQTVRIQFAGEDLDRDAVIKAENYQVVHQERAGDADKGKKAVTAVRVVDAAARIVELAVGGIVPGTYRLTILKDDKTQGVKDVFGNLLVGPNGSVTEGYSVTLNAAAAEPVLPSVSAGVTLQTGPPVEFPEYTKFREVPDGFNPSDRVETRVVRLYYNRDAHRIAQIVNRTVKSYNAAAVDVRRRAADRTRDDANEATDERKRLERAAVAAAGKARQAEAQLQQLQAQAADARTGGAQARSLIVQREQELTAARVAQQTAAQTADARAAADPAVAAQRQRVADLDDLLRADNAALTAPGGNPADKELYKQRIERNTKLRDLEQQQFDRTVTEARARATLPADQQVRRLEDEVARLRQAATGGDAIDQATQARLAAAQAAVQAAREEEVKATEAALAQDQRELRKREEQFRREVAAAREDPDTYAPGNPDSKDPVAQCSISVVGEGLIQIRGPIKGLNVIRIMINQMDAPAGQVRVAVHTIQVNGERAERMERVVANIQRYLDHSRFLTAQSGLMLRKAVTAVAARKAEEACAALPPNCSQAERDAKYLHAFFGKDFIDELVTLDSEFLKTGNKLLSLHSMDSTSLSAALFLLALAKNSVRAEILAEFAAQVQGQLPQDELAYYQAGLSGGSCCEACFDKRFYLLAYNARFQSLMGHFNAQINGDDTLSPIQREFIKLAQIFKNRLITELQLKQRVVERSLLEERIGPKYLEELDKARKKEEEAKAQLGDVEAKREEAIQRVTADLLRALTEEGIGDIRAAAGDVAARSEALIAALPVARLKAELAALQQTRNAVLDSAARLAGAREELANEFFAGSRRAVALEKQAVRAAAAPLAARPNPVEQIQAAILAGKAGVAWNQAQAALEAFDRSATESALVQEQAAVVARKTAKVTQEIEAREKSTGPTPDVRVWKDNPDQNQVVYGVADQTQAAAIRQDFRRLVTGYRRFRFTNPAANRYIHELEALLGRIDQQTGQALQFTPADIQLVKDATTFIQQVIDGQIQNVGIAVRNIVNTLSGQTPDTRKAYNLFTELRNDTLARLADQSLRASIAQTFQGIDRPFAKAVQLEIQYTQAVEKARLARRPLDEKKLLDLLVDEYEDKYIELLEGTRAHTANIDNYLKSVSTALEDDFNTQFYLPAFRRLREVATRGWDVHLGQIETTTVLTNNRTLGKVSPAATMEFDLPKRDIFLTEGFRSAKALFDEYGALLNDPTFLALAKAYSGMPVSGQVGTGGGLSPVRNVLPGLPTSADELLMAQAGPNRKEFGAALEALIPDPAIYKFETGTGYEVRPVLSPDGQSVVFNFDYMYTTDVREPVRADEKHLGRVKRHFVHTDVQLGNYELREVSKYMVALKASRTGKGVALLQDIPAVGVLFRPLPSQGSSLQQNLIYSQAVLFPTLFDLMGLRYAQAVADLDPLAGRNDEWVVRGRRKDLEQRIFDVGASRVDDALRIPFWERRPDLYRTQESIGWEHPNGYFGPGLRQRDSHLQEGYDPRMAYPQYRFAPGSLPSPGASAGYPYPADGLLEPGQPLPAGAIPLGPGSPFPPRSGSAFEVPTRPGPTTVHRGGPPPVSNPLGAPRPAPDQPTVTPPPGGSTLPYPGGVPARPSYPPDRQGVGPGRSSGP